MTQEELESKTFTSASTEFYAEGEVEEVGGKKVVRFRIPPDFQGHTFAMDLLKRNNEELVRSGPFRIEYVLGSEFIMHFHDLSSVDLDSGFANLRITSPLKGITIQYTWPDQKAEPRQAQVELKEKGGLLQRITITLPEPDLTAAVTIAGKLIASILDSISFRKRIPLQIRHIEIFQAETGDLLRR